MKPHASSSSIVLSRRTWLLATVAGALGSSLSLAGCGDSDSKSTERPDVAASGQSASQAVSQGLVGAAMGWLEPGAKDTVPTSVSVAGLRQLGGAALQVTDPLYIGSNSKAMTAMVIAKLVERGRMAWHWRVVDVLPNVAAVMREDYAQITLDQWLDHLGGVVPLNGTTDDEQRFMADLLADPNPLPETSHGRRLYVTQWVLQQSPPAGVVPGQDFSYSNAGYMVAATLAEAVTGQDFESLLQTLLIEPLGLTMNWRMTSELPAEVPHGAEGPAVAQLQVVEPMDAEIELWLQTLAPAGKWACTPQSYATWLNTLLAALRGEHTPLAAAAVARLRGLVPGDYALGWQGVSVPGATVLAHTGYIEGFMAEAVVESTGQWAGFGVTNTGWMDDASGTSWVLSVLDAQIAAMAQRRGKLPATAAAIRFSGRIGR